jgi:uncharacterized membrane protein
VTAESPNENVATVASLRARLERDVSPHQWRVERFTSTVARPSSLYAILGLVAAWVAYNLAARRLGIPAFDPPPFAWLQCLVGLSALLMSTMVLVTQSRQARDLEQRAQLDLQVNLLAEQKIAKLVALVEELRRDIPTVSNRVDPVAEVMQEPVDPHAVLSALAETREEGSPVKKPRPR